jgi:hypothetical protein
MKISCYLPGIGMKRKVVARFGRAKLVRTPDCGYELHGGSDEDHAEAREWVSLFFHETVIRKVAAVGDKREKLCPRRGQAQETRLCG